MYVGPCIVYACRLLFVVLLVQCRTSYDVGVSGLRHDILEPTARRQVEDNFDVGRRFPVTLVREATCLGNLPQEKPVVAVDAANFVQLRTTRRDTSRPRGTEATGIQSNILTRLARRWRNSG